MKRYQWQPDRTAAVLPVHRTNPADPQLEITGNHKPYISKHIRVTLKEIILEKFRLHNGWETRVSLRTAYVTQKADLKSNTLV